MKALAPGRVVRSWLAVIVLGVCAGATAACGYQPGSFRDQAAGAEFGGERATVGCLDVAVAGRWYPVSPSGQLVSPSGQVVSPSGQVVSPSGQVVSPSGQVVEMNFANRCDRPLVVDFTALRAFGRDDRGREQPLALFDPRGEVRPLGLEARTVGREVLELRIGLPVQQPVPPRIVSACLDVGRLDRSTPAAAPRWLCVARPPDAQATAGKTP